MSWEQNIEKEYKITTGEGSVFSVLWQVASKAYEFNVSQFEFIGVKGTLVDRREVKGRTFPIEVYLQGDDHLKTAKRFETASFDKRPWKIDHPLYGLLTVQPMSLQFNNTESVNYTKISGVVMETMTKSGVQTTRDPIDTIEGLQTKSLNTSAQAFEITAVPVPTDMATNNETIYNLGKSKISVQSEFEGYFNAYTEATNAIDNAVAEPLAAVRIMQAVIEAPARFYNDVKTRVDLFNQQATALMSALTINLNTPKSQKALFENNVLSLISSMSLASGLPLKKDYRTSKDVVDIITIIINIYNRYVTILGQLQTGNGSNPKQERLYVLEDDDNVIVLSHRFYGPSTDDDKLNQFIDENNIGLSEILGLKKGRVVKYYI